MKPCLIVDTSIQGVAVAIADLGERAAGRVLYHAQHPENMGSVVAISDLVERGLRATSIRAADLAGCAVGIGPGSFTGIKVGLAFVYGLKLAAEMDLPLFGTSGLEAAAEILKTREQDDEKAPCDGYAVFLPATRTHGFVGISTPAGPRSLLVDATDHAAVTALVSGLPAGGQVGIVGEWALLEEALGSRPRERLLAAEVCARAVHGMARRAVHAWPNGFGTAIPEPRYLRLSTAEERLQQLTRGGLQ